MSPLFPSILVPLDGSVTAARSLGCAVWLATGSASACTSSAPPPRRCRRARRSSA